MHGHHVYVCVCEGEGGEGDGAGGGGGLRETQKRAGNETPAERLDPT